MINAYRFDKINSNEILFIIRELCIEKQRSEFEMSKVTFDYSKAASFISEEEVGYMSKLVDNAKKSYWIKPEPEMISWAGWIFR